MDVCLMIFRKASFFACLFMVLFFMSCSKQSEIVYTPVTESVDSEDGKYSAFVSSDKKLVVKRNGDGKIVNVQALEDINDTAGVYVVPANKIWFNIFSGYGTKKTYSCSVPAEEFLAQEFPLSAATVGEVRFEGSKIHIEGIQSVAVKAMSLGSVFRYYLETGKGDRGWVSKDYFKNYVDAPYMSEDGNQTSIVLYRSATGAEIAFSEVTNEFAYSEKSFFENLTSQDLLSNVFTPCRKHGVDGFTYYRFLMPAPFYAGGGIRPDDVNELSASYEGPFTFIILNGKKYLVLKNQNYCVLIAEDNSVFFEGLGLFPGFASRSESSYLRVKSPYEVVECSYDAADLESVGGSPWSAGKKNFGIGAEINIECTNTYANGLLIFNGCTLYDDPSSYEKYSRAKEFEVCKKDGTVIQKISLLDIPEPQFFALQENVTDVVLRLTDVYRGTKKETFVSCIKSVQCKNYEHLYDELKFKDSLKRDYIKFCSKDGVLLTLQKDLSAIKIDGDEFVVTPLQKNDLTYLKFNNAEYLLLWSPLFCTLLNSDGSIFYSGTNKELISSVDSFTSSVEFASSSQLSESDGVYDSNNLQKLEGCIPWVEADEDFGLGEYVEVKSDSNFSALVFYNGFISSENPYLYAYNNRVRKLCLYDDKGQLIDRVELEDSPSPQVVSLLPNSYHYVRIQIESVYPGDKWNDTCLSCIQAVPAESSWAVTIDSSAD